MDLQCLLFTLTFSPILSPSFSHRYLPQTISQMSTDNMALCPWRTTPYTVYYHFYVLYATSLYLSDILHLTLYMYCSLWRPRSRCEICLSYISLITFDDGSLVAAETYSLYFSWIEMLCWLIHLYLQTTNFWQGSEFADTQQTILLLRHSVRDQERKPCVQNMLSSVFSSITN